MLKCFSHSHTRKQHKQFPKAAQDLGLQLACVPITAGCQKTLGFLDRCWQVLQPLDSTKEQGQGSQWTRSVTADSQEELSSWGPRARPLWTLIPTEFCVNPSWLCVTCSLPYKIGWELNCPWHWSSCRANVWEPLSKTCRTLQTSFRNRWVKILLSEKLKAYGNFLGCIGRSNLSIVSNELEITGYAIWV